MTTKTIYIIENDASEFAAYEDVPHSAIVPLQTNRYLSQLIKEYSGSKIVYYEPVESTIKFELKPGTDVDEFELLIELILNGSPTVPDTDEYRIKLVNDLRSVVLCSTSQ